ncbi:MAG TPA: xanthine dehydrogenase family protein molybdopterin-binding subunit [Candidatus Polarisedimenticolaceae bacterium]|nr:xanthine dehydrogenase family protein molybdopterin-binding subunit [Candidatus Polarisedimenticolaceae bacterium]
MSDFIGSRTRSKEGPRHVSGRGLYTDDFMLPGMLQAMILRSPHAHAKILSVDPSQALTNPNVIAVITPDDIKKSTKPFKPGRYAAGLKRPIDEYAGAIDKVRYVGEPLGAIAARDRGTAEDALELISVEYDPIRPVVDVREAIKPSSATLFDELGSNLAWHGSLQYGDIDGAFNSADRVIKENLKIHRYSSTPLEPFVVIASYDSASKRLTVWVTAQVPEVIYDGLREALGLQDVRVIIPDVGGGFGQKIHLIRKYVVMVALLSMKTGRPVKWVEDRSEHMMAGGHACAQEFEAEAAVKNDATVLGLRFKEYDDVGGSISTLTIHFTNKLNNLSNTYRTPSIAMEGYAVVTNKCPVIPNRGIGKPGMCYIWERMMDRVAQDLNMSPIEVRRKNLIQPSEMPYRTISGNVYDSGDYPGLLSTLLEKIEYDKLREEQKREREKGRLIGIGIVVGVEPGGRNAARDMAIFPEMKEPPGSGGVNGATIKLEKNGTIALHLGSPNCGQAHETTTAQVAADVLGTTPDQISTSIPFDSDLSPWGVAAANSGNNFHLYDIGAIHGAAKKLREKVVKLAAHLLNADAEELTIENGVVQVPGSATKKVTFAELGRIAYNNQHLIPDDMEAGLQATYYYTFPHAKPNIVPGADRLVRAQFTFSAGAHAAIIEVDKATGKVEILRYLIVGDNGTVINPDVVNGQVYGSAAHGIAVALGEGFIYSPEGQPLTITYLDYGKCSTAETPKVEVIHRPSPSPFTSLGQKAAGEGAAIPSPAAIASAVEDALTPFGVKITDLPLTPEVVWRLANYNPDSVRRSY